MNSPSRGRVRWLSFVGLSMLLVGAIGMQLFLSNPLPIDAELPLLDKYVPELLSGWSVENESLAAMGIPREAVLRELNFDAYVFRSYNKGGQSFSIYVAYWRPGKMPAHLVATHTPDTCWVGQGWTCEQRATGHVLAIGEQEFLPAQWRLYAAPNGIRLQVLFWHVVGEHSLLFERQNILRWWQDAFLGLGSQKHDQYFIRISSPQSFDELMASAEFREILSRLGQLVLWQGEQSHRT